MSAFRPVERPGYAGFLKTVFSLRPFYDRSFPSLKAVFSPPPSLISDFLDAFFAKGKVAGIFCCPAKKVQSERLTCSELFDGRIFSIPTNQQDWRGPEASRQDL